MDLKDRRAVITGASAGIGAEFARQLHRAGAEVLLIARRGETLAQLSHEMNQVRANSARYRVIDLNKLEAGTGGLPEAIEILKNETVDIFINNAGRGSFGEFDKLPIERELQMVSLNINATMSLTHAVIPQMKARRAGSIVSVSSIVGFQPTPFMATYSATKAFNYSHSLALRNELAPYGIKVVTLCPGPTATEFRFAAEMPGESWESGSDSVQNVVRSTLWAMERNKAIVVPGMRAKLLSFPSRVLPKPLATWLSGQVLRRVFKAPH